jgi:hypothetical protein
MSADILNSRNNHPHGFNRDNPNAFDPSLAIDPDVALDPLDSATPPKPVYGYSTQDTMASAVEEERRHLTSDGVDELKKAAMAELNAELTRGNAANFERMLDAALKVVALQMRLSGRFDHELVQDYIAKGKDHLMAVQGAWVSRWGMAFTVLSAAGSLACAALGGFNLFAGSSFYAVDTVKSVGKVVNLGGTAAQGIGGVGRIFDEKVASERYGRQDAHERHKKQTEELNTSLQQFKQRLNELMRQKQETQATKHQTFERQG